MGETKNKGIFYGYWILLGTVLLHFLDSGLYFYGFSVFYTPIKLEYAWSAAAISGAISFSRLEGGIEGPVVGYLIEKYGARKILALGVLITGLGYMMMIYVNSVWMLYLVYGGVLSIGYNMGFTHSLTTLLNNWFVKRRARVMSLYAIAAGLGGAVIVPLLSKSIMLYGWKTTAIYSGLAFWIVGIPATLIFRNYPEDMGLLPDGVPAVELDKETVVALEDEPKLTTREALQSGVFKRLLLAESLRTFLLASIVLHEIPHLVNIGIDEVTAAGILGLMISISIPGRLIFGFLGDYIEKRKLLAVTMIIQGIGVLVFAYASTIAHVYIFVVLYGLTYGGCIPLLMAFRGDLFGRKKFAQMSGIMSPFRTIGNVIGPVFAGYLFDVTGSYKIAFITFTCIAIMSGISFYFVKGDHI
ncbi:MAG: MFS transporter [Candidatus Bathyarchaeota archaeon]|nr:MFS transporter [Candidatus Bathyarchaeota archaeon]